MLHEFAPAKLNLYLHITGRQPNGYHDLDSLVAFAGIGDDIHIQPADHFSFIVEGPQAGPLRHQPEASNLVVKAAHSLAALTGKKLDVQLTLIKNLPVASGIGGGSSDAAAALRSLARYWNIPLNDPRLIEAAAQHGQDVPVCLKIQNNYMTATGTREAHALPYADIVLINPLLELPTPAVYASYRNGGYGFIASAPFKRIPTDLAELVTYLKERENSLFRPACDLCPEIKTVIKALEQSGSLLARMSGSGATCFGLYPDAKTASDARNAVLKIYPGWWIEKSSIPYLGTASI